MGKRKWRVVGRVVASTYIGEFEADSAEEAIEMAWRKASVSVCNQCSDRIEDPEIDEMFAEEDDSGSPQ